jgi:hypothetical protein
MRPVNVTIATISVGNWIPLDVTENPASIAIGCRILAAATATYGVEYTYDDPFDTVTAPVAFGYLTGIPSGTVASKDTALTSPVRAVRLNVSAVTGAGVKMTVLQGLGL